MNKITTLALIALGAVGLSACGGGGSAGGGGPIIETTTPTYKERSHNEALDEHEKGVTGQGAQVVTVDYFDGDNDHGHKVENIIRDYAPGATFHRIDIASDNPQFVRGEIYNLSLHAYDTRSVGLDAGGGSGTASDYHWMYNWAYPTDLYVVISGNNHQYGATCETRDTCSSIALAGIDWIPDNVIVVGALNDDGTALTEYSVPAGITKDHFIAAPVHSEDAGTSFAAPVVSGTAALIMDKFDIEAADTRAIIFRTADDLGAPGVDNVYGHGRLNVRRALSPVGNIR